MLKDVECELTAELNRNSSAKFLSKSTFWTRWAYANFLFKRNAKIELMVSVGIIVYVCIVALVSPIPNGSLVRILSILIVSLICVFVALLAFYAFNLNIGDRMIEIVPRRGQLSDRDPRIFLRIWKNDHNVITTFLTTGNVSDERMLPHKDALTQAQRAVAVVESRKNYIIDRTGQLRSHGGTIVPFGSSSRGGVLSKEIFRPLVFLFSGVVTFFMLLGGVIALLWINVFNSWPEDSDSLIPNLIFAAMLVMGILANFCRRSEERAWYLLGQRVETRSNYFDATKDMRDYLVALIFGWLTIILITVAIYSLYGDKGVSSESMSVTWKVISAIILLLTISSVGKVFGSAKSSFDKAMWDNRRFVS